MGGLAIVVHLARSTTTKRAGPLSKKVLLKPSNNWNDDLLKSNQIVYLSEAFFFKMGQPRPLFCLFFSNL